MSCLRGAVKQVCSYILPLSPHSPQGKVILGPFVLLPKNQILRSQFRDSQMQHMQAVDQALNGEVKMLGYGYRAIEELPTLKPNIFTLENQWFEYEFPGARHIFRVLC